MFHFGNEPYMHYFYESFHWIQCTIFSPIEPKKVLRGNTTPRIWLGPVVLGERFHWREYGSPASAVGGIRSVHVFACRSVSAVRANLLTNGHKSATGFLVLPSQNKMLHRACHCSGIFTMNYSCYWILKDQIMYFKCL